jgi:hypothetical protein
LIVFYIIVAFLICRKNLLSVFLIVLGELISVLLLSLTEETDSKSSGKGQQKIDIFAQQYAFIACLKVLMEEMQTLAIGFEFNGWWCSPVNILRIVNL